MLAMNEALSIERGMMELQMEEEKEDGLTREDVVAFRKARKERAEVQGGGVAPPAAPSEEGAAALMPPELPF